MAKKKRRIYSLLRRIYPNKKYKARLFQRVFEDKKDLLELYNAMNRTSYQNPDDLEITTLEDVIYLSMKNDLSFIIASSLNLYEHQSTFNPNMPIRGLLYFARLYEAYIEKHKFNIYGEKLILLPVPQYIAFYNGKKKIPEESFLKLSDAFYSVEKDRNGTGTPMLECVVRVYNITPGNNEALLNRCRRLHDYSAFIAEIDKNLSSGMELEDALHKAIDTCIENDILADILVKSKSEVYRMLLTKYDEKEFIQITYQEGLEKGLEKGREEERSRINQLYKLLLEQERMDDIKKAIHDKSFQEELLEKFHL